jgi:hypothetical protein
MSLYIGILASQGSGGALLDSYGGAAAAFSLRKLSSTYGGAAVRVRRSLDNTEQDIQFAGGQLDQAALQAFVGYENLFQRSEEFENAYWNKFNSSIIQNSTNSPIGTLTADTLIENTANNYHTVGVATPITVVSGQTYTFTVYAKQASGTRFIGLQPVNATVSGNNQTAVFDLVNGVFLGNVTAPSPSSPIGAPFNSTNTSIQSVGNGWYRISATTTVTGTLYYCGITLLNAFSSAGLVYTGDGTSSVYIWGAQFNQGVTAQPYQQTVATANTANGFVTRWYTQDGNGENLLLQSQTFEAAQWVKADATISANSTTAPDGTLTADTIIPSTTNAAHYTIQTLSKATTNITYTYSVYVKASGYSYGAVAVAGAFIPNQAQCLFDLVNGTTSISAIGTGFTVLSSSISNVGNGWYRISLTFLSDTSNQVQPYVRVDQSATIPVYAGNGTSGLFVWGAQLSQSSWLQGYQATTTTAVSRRDASQATAASQPRIVNAGVIERENGKPAIRFDGVDDSITRSNFGFPTTNISMTKVGSRAPSGFNYDDIGYSSFGGGLINLNNSIRIGFDGRPVSAYVSSTAPVPTKVGQIFQLNIYDRVNLKASANGSDFGTTSVAAATIAYATQDLIIGAIPSSLNYSNGTTQELVMWGTDQTVNRLGLSSMTNSFYQMYWQGTQQALLDQFGGSAAAFSLRNLSSSYRGPLVRVRRSSDNAETDIGGTFSGDLDVNSLLAFTGGQNLFPYSQEFENAAWLKSNLTVTANATIAPDGTLTAEKLVETAINSYRNIYQSYSTTGVVTFSVYAKAAERNILSFRFFENTSPFPMCEMLVDISNGQFINRTVASGVIFSSSVTSVGNGWYRISLSGTTNRLSASLGVIEIGTGTLQNPIFTYLGVAGSGVYVWGAQLTTGSVLQPYVPTTTAAINGANAFVTKWYDQSGIGDNLVLQSESFNITPWLYIGSSILPDTINSPIATLTADSLNETATTGSHVAYQPLAVSAIGPLTASVYLKAKERIYAQLSIATGGIEGLTRYGVIVDLQNGTIIKTDTLGSPTGGSSSISDAGNGWYRVSVSLNATTTTASSNYIVLGPSNSANPIYTAGSLDPSYTGIAGSGVYVWGAQVSVGSQLLRYQPTTTAIAPKRDAIQTTAASQPRIVNAGSVESENGKPAVYSNANAMTFPAIALNNFTVLWVSRKETELPTGSIILNNSSNDNTYMGDDVDIMGNPSAYSSADIITRLRNNNSINGLETTYHIAYLNRRGTQAVGQFNNSENPYNNAVASTVFNINSIGNYTTFPTYNYTGDLQEILIYSDDRSANRAPISSNINTYYQIYWQGNGTALLDSYSGASAAYSLRNLSSAYTGPLIRVRRSSDNLERDIYGTFRGDLDLAALTSFVGANSGFVTTWYDQSGTGRHATQATAGSQPRIVNAGAVDTLNGKPAVYNTSTTGMSFTPITLTNFTVLWVSKRDNTVTTQSIMLAGNTANYMGDDTDDMGNPVAFVSGGSIVRNTLNNTSPSGLETTYHLSYINRRNSTEAVGQFNNSNNSYNNSVLSTSSTLSSIANYGSNYNYLGNIQEILMYSDDRSSSRTGMSSNINNYYKIY